MAGANGLGKVPGQPGSVRPAGGTKNRTIDVFSEEGVVDVDYLKAVQDIEDQQQRQGWLFGRGAFDKGDLLYLRDQEEQLRFEELERRDSERTAFASLRSRAEDAQGPMLPKIVKKDRAPSSRAATLTKLKPVVKLKPAVRPKPAADTEAAASKRQRTDAGSTAADSSKQDAALKPAQQQQQQSTVAEGREEAGLPGLLGDYGSSDSDGGGEDDS